MGEPLELIRHWRLAVQETRLAIHFLRARAEVDAERVAVVGYSLGSFLATLLASEEKSVRAVVVAAGGDLPSGIPFATLLGRRGGSAMAAAAINAMFSERAL